MNAQSSFILSDEWRCIYFLKNKWLVIQTSFLISQSSLSDWNKIICKLIEKENPIHFSFSLLSWLAVLTCGGALYKDRWIAHGKTSDVHDNSLTSWPRNIKTSASFFSLQKEKRESPAVAIINDISAVDAWELRVLLFYPFGLSLFYAIHWNLWRKRHFGTRRNVLGCFRETTEMSPGIISDEKKRGPLNFFKKIGFFFITRYNKSK